jgi:hypothetical protein
MQRIISKRERTILYLTIFVIVFAVFFNFLIAPVLSRYDNLTREIKVNSAKLKKYRRLLGQKDIIQGKYKSFSSSLKVSGAQRDNVLSTLAALEEMAKNANLRIVDVRPERQRLERNRYKEITIELKTEGSMESYLKFIYDIQNSLLLLRIKEFQLNARANTQSLEGNFTIAQPIGLN